MCANCLGIAARLITAAHPEAAARLMITMFLFIRPRYSLYPLPGNA